MKTGLDKKETLADSTGQRGLIFDVKRYAIHDGPGIRTTIFFKGCPLRCNWCHNPESWYLRIEQGFRKGRCVNCGRCIEVCEHGAIAVNDGRARGVSEFEKCVLCGECVKVCVYGAREFIGRWMSVDEAMLEIEKDRVFYEQSGGGVTFSGGEPLMQPAFLMELLRRCKEHGIQTVVDTSCYGPAEVVEAVGEQADMFLCDLKHMESEVHKRSTGAGNELILSNIRYLSSIGKPVVIRCPVIKGFNDDDANIKAMAEFIRPLEGVVRVDILPYNAGGYEKKSRLSGKYDIILGKRLSDERMAEIARIIAGFGIEVKAGV